MRLQFDNLVVVAVTLAGAYLWLRTWMIVRPMASVEMRAACLVASVASLVLCLSNMAFIAGANIPEINGWFAASQLAMAVAVTVLGVVIHAENTRHDKH